MDYPPRVLALVEEICAAGDEKSRTAYDLLRLPVFRSNFDHVLDWYHMLNETLLSSPCRRAGAAQGYLQEGLDLITGDGQTPDDAGKAIYDASLRARCVVKVTALPVPAHPTILSTPLSTLANPHVYDVYDGNLFEIGDDKGGGVQGYKKMDWRIVNPKFMPLHRENTFWLALAYGFKDDFKYWAQLKARTLQYYNNVLQDKSHPRHAVYTILDNNVTRPSTLTNQLDPALPLYNVTPELWQVVADALKIELLVIVHAAGYHDPGKQANERNKVYPCIPRGDHNARQVFVCLDHMHDPQHEYRAIIPVKRDRFAWRYVDHMPSDRQTSPTTTTVRDRDLAQIATSNQRRCPFLKHDVNGVPTLPLTMMDDAGGNPVPGPSGPPGPILDDSASDGGITDAQVLVYFNNGVNNP